MNYMLVLVALLHLCANVSSSAKCYTGIITDLIELNMLYKDNRDMINSKQILVPSPEMHENACICLGVFAQEVKQFFSNNVTVNSQTKNVIHKINASLGDLETHNKMNQSCQMDKKAHQPIRLKPFQPYITYLRELTKAKGCQVKCY